MSESDSRSGIGRGIVECGGKAVYCWTPAAGVARADCVRAATGFHTLRGWNFHSAHPGHVHPTYVLGVIDRGALVVARRGEEFIARAGSVVALSPWEVHEERALDREGWSFRYLYPTAQLVAAISGGELAGAGPAAAFLQPVLDDEVLATQIGEAFELISRSPCAPAVGTAMVTVLRRAFGRHGYSLEGARLTGGRRAVNVARAFLHSRELREVSLARLAQLAGMSRFHLCRQFRDEVGLSPYAYYDQLRIARAKDLLHRGVPLSRIAFRLGFSDQSHFTRHFKRTSAVTPGVYGRMVLKAVNRGVDPDRTVAAAEAVRS
jgi:AraC-like DNA-binding protein